jgi:hypothetical protein
MQRIRSALHVLIEGLTKSDLEITFVGLTRLQEGVKKIKTDMDEVTKLYADLLSNLSGICRLCVKSTQLLIIFLLERIEK